MQISNVRYIFTKNSTIGKLYVDDKDIGVYMMEPCDRGLTGLMTLDEIKAIKVAGATAIPTDTYLLQMISGAPIFERFLPHPGVTKNTFFVPELINVKDFEGILWHPGTLPHQTEGCNMPGLEIVEADHIGQSWEAFDKLNAICFDAIRKDKVYYSIGRDPDKWNAFLASQKN